MTDWRWKKLVGLSESWRLLDGRGRNRCTVWPNGTWHTWDETGVGGENASEVNEDVAKAQALASVVRQGWAVIRSPRLNRRGRPE